jgi:TRAP-type mannitol/chloroaromatic compound transport system permease large subunit
VTTVMAVVMAAMSGIIGGEIVLLGLVALPQMLRLGYNQNLAIGTVCVGGSLGTMIPPSIVLIVYGLITETSIHSLFIAAVIPGLMLGGIYILYIIVRTRLNRRWHRRSRTMPTIWPWQTRSGTPGACCRRSGWSFWCWARSTAGSPRSPKRPASAWSAHW